jgi:glycosyltransferase involved in cell wall biosynthesis
VVHTYFFWPIIYGRLLKASGTIEHLVENREDQGFSWGPAEYALLKLTRSLPDRVVCVADAVRELVVRRERLEPGKVLTIRNGVSVGESGVGSREWGAAASAAASLRSELGLAPGDLVVGAVSNLNRRVKGVDYLLRAAVRILEQVPSARFLILGGGRLRPELERLAAELGVASRVSFAGHRQDIVRYYAAMDVSVLTSLSEGLSITLLESLAHGLPVVVTDVGGNREVVVDGECGFVVPPRDVEAFAERVVRLLHDSGLRAAFGRAGRQRCEREFAIGAVAERYRDVYRDVIGAGE